jgi:hypothetical protein
MAINLGEDILHILHFLELSQELSGGFFSNAATPSKRKLAAIIFMGESFREENLRSLQEIDVHNGPSMSELYVIIHRLVSSLYLDFFVNHTDISPLTIDLVLFSIS